MAIIKGNPSNSITIGGMTFPANKSGLKILTARVTGAGSYSSFREFGSATDYVVPVGKTFKCLAIKGFEFLGTDGRVGVGYANAAAAWAGGSAPSTPIFSIGGSSTVRYCLYLAPQGTQEIIAQGFNVPAGKYPFAYCDPAGNDITIYLIGYEE